MTYKNLFGNLALSAAMAASGAANAFPVAAAAPAASSAVAASAPAQPASVLQQLLQTQSQEKAKTVAEDNAKAEAKDAFAPSVIAFAQRVTIAEHASTLKECFASLNIEEKPVTQMDADSAAKIVNCMDQQAIISFASDPVHKNVGVSTLLRSYGKESNAVAELLETNERFAKKVGSACFARENKTPVDVPEFVNCAYIEKLLHRNYTAEFAGIAGVVGLAIAGIAVMGRMDRRSYLGGSSTNVAAVVAGSNSYTM